MYICAMTYNVHVHVAQLPKLGMLYQLQMKLSEDNFEALRGEAYDLGTITEVVEEILTGSGQQLSLSLPAYDEVRSYGDIL